MNLYTIDSMLYRTIHARNGVPSPPVVKNLAEFEQAAAKGESARYFPSPHVMIQNVNSDLDIVQIEKASHTMVATSVRAGTDFVYRGRMVSSNAHVATFQDKLSSVASSYEFVGISSGIGDTVESFAQYMAQSYRDITDKPAGGERRETLQLSALCPFKTMDQRRFVITTKDTQAPTDERAARNEERLRMYGNHPGPAVDMTLDIDKSMSTHMTSGRMGAIVIEDTDAHGVRKSQVLQEMETPSCYPVSFEMYTSFIPHKG
jgi:hypothetical protein